MLGGHKSNLRKIALLLAFYNDFRLIPKVRLSNFKFVKPKLPFGKKFLLRHFFGQVLNRKNPSFIRASLLSFCFISPRFCLFEFKITSSLEKYVCGFIHV
jgi:hypothetical protein